MSVLDVLSSGNYITFNKAIAKKLGIDEAILLGELCSKQAMYGGEFFIQMDRIAEDTCLSEYRIRNAMNSLKSAGLLTVEKKGLPAKNHYLLDLDALSEMLGLSTTCNANIRSTSGANFGTTGDSEFDITKGNRSRKNKYKYKEDSSSSSPDYSKWEAAYNDNAPSLPRMRTLGDKRRAAVRSMIAQGITLEEFGEACRKVNASAFCTGENDRGWRADATWMFNANNVIKALEGRYDDSGKKKKTFGPSYEEAFSVI